MLILEHSDWLTILGAANQNVLELCYKFFINLTSSDWHCQYQGQECLRVSLMICYFFEIQDDL